MPGPKPHGEALNWTAIASSAYYAYGWVTGGVNYQGKPMPAWGELPEKIRWAWEAAVRQAGSCLDCLPGTTAPDPSRWNGWHPEVSARLEPSPGFQGDPHDPG